MHKIKLARGTHLRRTVSGTLSEFILHGMARYYCWVIAMIQLELKLEGERGEQQGWAGKQEFDWGGLEASCSRSITGMWVWSPRAAPCCEMSAGIHSSWGGAMMDMWFQRSPQGHQCKGLQDWLQQRPCPWGMARWLSAVGDPTAFLTTESGQTPPGSR